jgi:hypothetical protein
MVVPASWGDELIATDVIARCAARSNHPVIQCSCPRVSERLASHSTTLDDAIFWLVSPPVAVAKYLRSVEAGREIHVTYAGSCPGAADASIDECITPGELLAALRSRGIDLSAQPKVFSDIIPADRRRHASSAGGLPDQTRLWETASFRLSQPPEGDLSVGIAQLLLAEERLLIDISPMLGCSCRTADDRLSEDLTTLQRSPSPVVVTGKVDLSRQAPSPPLSPSVEPRLLAEPAAERPIPNIETRLAQAARPSQSRATYRRQSTWRRQSPRPGIVVARTSGMMTATDNVPFLRRPEARAVVTALIVTAAAALIIGLWIGRRTAPVTTGSGESANPTHLPIKQIAHSRSPQSRP